MAGRPPILSDRPCLYGVARMGDEAKLKQIIDRIAEAQTFSRKIEECPELQRHLVLPGHVEAIYDALVEVEVQPWVEAQAPDLFLRFRERCACGEYKAAWDLARRDLLPRLIDAASSGRDDRVSTPDEIRQRDPDSFRTIAVVPRENVVGWLRGEGGR